MREQTADVPLCCLRDQRVALRIEKKILFSFPETLVTVHSRAIVAEQRLGHERRRFPVCSRDVLDDVLVQHQMISHLRERSEAHVDLVLPARRDLVVMHFDLDAGRDHLQHDL